MAVMDSTLVDLMATHALAGDFLPADLIDALHERCAHIEQLPNTNHLRTLTVAPLQRSLA